MTEGFDAKTSFEEYSKDLAFQMFLSDTTSVKEQSGSYLMKSKTMDTWSRFFDPMKSNTRLSLQGIPHRKDGDRVGFIHKSILEYFVAKVLFQEVSKAQDEKINKNSFLNLKLIVKEPAIIGFLVDMFRDKDHHINLLWQIVFQSRSSSSATSSHIQKCETVTASANSITILNCLGLSFSGKDLSGIKIGGADLSFAIMDSVNLEGSDLSDVSMRGIHLVNSNLSNCDLNGVNLFELPSLLGHTNSVIFNFIFISLYNK